MEKPRVLIIDDDPNLRKTLSDILRVKGYETFTAGDGEKALTFLRNNPVDLSLIDLGLPDIPGLEVLARAKADFPAMEAIILTGNATIESAVEATKQGACSYLVKPYDIEQLVNHIQNALRKHQQAGMKIITVYNPLGGMGTTTIAVNLATCLAGNNSKVALIDLNLVSGDVATFLNINPKFTLSSVTKNISRIDSSFMMSIMTQHSSGMYVLTGPLDVDESNDVTPEQISRILTIFREMFSHVIIDAGGYIAGCNKAVFEASDFILYNTVISLPNLKNTKRYITSLEKNGFQKGRVKLLVNRYTQRSDINIENAEQFLDWKVFHTIPNEYKGVVDSINNGVPIVTLFPRSAVSKAIVRLSELLK
jgi:pilus assembly protein CpaE